MREQGGAYQGENGHDAAVAPEPLCGSRGQRGLSAGALRSPAIAKAGIASGGGAGGAPAAGGASQGGAEQRKSASSEEQEQPASSAEAQAGLLEETQPQAVPGRE